MITSIDAWHRKSRKAASSLGVALARDNGTDDPHAGRIGWTRDDMMQLQVHLDRRLRFVLDMGCGIFDQPFPLTQVGAESGDLSLRTETAAQQTKGM